MGNSGIYVGVLCAGLSFGQTPSAAVCGLAHPGQCIKDVVIDQGGVWTAPFHAHKKEVRWLLPLAGTTAVALHFDLQAQNAFGMDRAKLNASRKAANFGSPYATAGGAAALYFIGLGMHNEHILETGRLGAEAVVDASLVAAAIKMATNRQRLDSGPGQGGFWPHGTNSFELNSSFPSGHAAASWAVAHVIATEYPNNKAVRIAAYAFATAISVSRVSGRAHFPSDVVVGSAFGYLIGGYVTRHRASERASRN